MFVDIPAGGESGDEPVAPRCRSCKQPIAPGSPRETLSFPTDDALGLSAFNGAYHAGCAQPYASLKRALDMLSRGLG